MSTILVNNVKSYTGDTVTISGSNILVQGQTTLGDGNGNDTVKVRADLGVSGSVEVSGSITPNVDNAFDLASFGKQWKDLYVGGTAFLDTITPSGSINNLRLNAFNSSSIIISSSESGDVEIKSDRLTTLSSKKNILVATTGTGTNEGQINITSTRTTGNAIRILGAATTSSTVDINAGILDIDATAAATLNATSVAINAASGELDLTTLGTMDINAGHIFIETNKNTSASGTFHVDADGTGSAISFNTEHEAGFHGATNSIAFEITANANTGSITGINAGILDINTLSSASITSTGNHINSILLHANAGTSETIKIHSDQGTGASSIEITSDAGSIDINSGDNITIDAADDITILADNIFTKHITLDQDIKSAAATDAAHYIINGKRGEIRSRLQAGVAVDTGFTLQLRNTSIAANSLIVANVIGGNGGIITGSVVTANVISANSASFNFFNTGNAALADNAIFTASFAIF